MTAPGARVGDYELGELLGSGGVGAVYRARHLTSGRAVAVKRSDPSRAAALRREAELLARAANPHVVGVLGVVEDAAGVWVVQELVDGPSLQEVLAAHRSLTPEQSLGVLRGGLTGLAHVHSLGLVHGDVSPRNVLFDRAGTAKLADFGSARGVGESGSGATPAFASPEAVQGAALTPASDVYSAAAVLYLLLAGRPVFAHRDVAAVLRAHVAEPAPELAGHGPHLADLLTRALAKDPAARPVDAAAFLAELEEAATRTFGPGWLARSAVAGVVAGLGAMATGTAAPVVGGGTVVAGSTAAAPVAALVSAGWSTGRKVVAASVAAVLAVGVAVVLFLGGGDDETDVQTAAEAEAVRTSQAAAATAAASSAAASTAAASSAAASSAQAGLQAALPDGVYEVTVTTWQSSIPLNPVGTVTNAQWTLTSTCGPATCTTEIVSSSGTVYAGSFDGARLVMRATVFYYCLDGSGAVIPGTERPDAFSFEPDLAVGSAPVGFTGTSVETSLLTADQVPTTCSQDYLVGSTASITVDGRYLGPAPVAAEPTD